MLCPMHYKEKPILTRLCVAQGRAGMDGGRGIPGETGSKVNSLRSHCRAVVIISINWPAPRTQRTICSIKVLSSLLHFLILVEVNSCVNATLPNFTSYYWPLVFPFIPFLVAMSIRVKTYQQQQISTCSCKALHIQQPTDYYKYWQWLNSIPNSCRKSLVNKSGSLDAWSDRTAESLSVKTPF